MTEREIRPAGPDDLARLRAIEDAADRLLVELLQATEWERATTGRARAATPGFLLVVAESPGGDPIGFAHVIEVDGLAHLEQVSVLPAHGRRGHGRALVDAAKREAAQRGYERITLRTYAEVPWNAALYAGSGFDESEPESRFHLELVRTEIESGLDRWGRRVQMTAPLP